MPVHPAEGDLPGGANLHVNALGLLQFGLIPRLELGGSTTFLVGIHAFNTGALSYIVIPSHDDDETFDFGIGGNLGLRHYFNSRGAQAGLYVGGFLEYAYLQVSDEEDDLASYQRQQLIPAAEAGYRWVWGSFLLDVGVLAGAAVTTSAEDTPIGANGCAYADSCLEESSTTPFAMAVLDVGFFL